MSHRPKIGPAAGKKRPGLKQKVENFIFVTNRNNEDACSYQYEWN